MAELNVKGVSGKSLDQVLSVEKARALDRWDLANMWKEQYQSRPFQFGYSMSKSHFDGWISRAKVWPLALIPLQKAKDLVENYVVEHNFHSTNACLGFCRLVDYQKFGPNARPIASVFSYSEFLEEKEIALLAGSFEGTLTDRTESLQLLLQTSEIYNKLFEWIVTFNGNPKSFDYQSYLYAVQNIYKLNKE